jgi:L-ascorbate metabolism protein UlaG (beta-lactamase superfamily)
MTQDLLQGITWLRHASFRIEAPDCVIYVDPWKLKPRATPADLILITHEHHDHFSPQDLDKIRTPDTTIVSIAAVTSELSGDLHTVQAGDRLTAKGIDIEVVPAYNMDKQFHPHSKGGVGYILTIGGRRIYHAGDTDAIPEMADIQADVALVPIGGKYTMDAQEAAAIVNKIRPSIAVPMHWGDLVGKRDDALAFREQCKVPVRIMEAE